MLLYVMRHGPAQDHAPSGYDGDRALTAEGRDLVRRAARELSRLRGSGIVRVLSSPLVRARETAEIVRSVVCPHALVELRKELVPDDSPPLHLIRELVTLGGDTLLVSHQPSVEQLVRILVDDAGQGALPQGFRTAMIVGLEVVLSSSAWGTPRRGVTPGSGVRVPAESAPRRATSPVTGTPIPSSDGSSPGVGSQLGLGRWRLRLVLDPRQSSSP